MSSYIFRWDDDKNTSNIVKHGITFDEATTTASNDEISFNDIPELTKEDFARGIRNPFAGKFRDGYTIIVEHADHDEVITIKKTRRPKGANVGNM
jgi:uncharacterized DUF497 family protein